MNLAPLPPGSFGQRVVVGVGDAATSNNPHVTLSTYALGSCLGVIAYDPANRTGGLLHLMLPDSSISRAKAASQPGMFADTGLPFFFRSLQGLKIDLSRLRIYLVGGASVLTGNDGFKIGERNVQATEAFLTKNGFAATHAAVGGTVNRTVHLAIGTGILTLKTPGNINTIPLGS